MLVGGQNDVSITPILKRRRNQNSESESLPTKRVSSDPASIQCQVILEYLKIKGTKSSYSTELKELEEGPAANQVSWLNTLAANVSKLASSQVATAGKIDPVIEFVQACLNLPWKLSDGPKIRSAYKFFLVSLVTTYLEYCKSVFKILFGLLSPDVTEAELEKRVNPHMLSAEFMAVRNCVLDTIVTLQTLVPLSLKYLLQEAVYCRPYYKKHPQVHVVYIKCLLQLGNRIPAIRKDLLSTVIHGVINIDVQCPREDLFDQEEEEQEEEEEKKMEDFFQMEVDDPHDEEASLQRERESSLKWMFLHPEGHTLDAVLNALLLYVHCTLHDQPYTLDTEADIQALTEKGCPPASVKMYSNSQSSAAPPSADNDTSATDAVTKTAWPRRMTVGCQCGGQQQVPIAKVRELYDHLWHIFTNALLTTHSLGHIQFIVFYFLSIRPGFARIFLEDLTKVFVNFSSAVEIRKNAMAYIGSLLSRASFVSFSLVQSCIEVIVNWCHSYVKNQIVQQKNNYMNVGLHQLFYGACQTIFYVFSFRCVEFTRSEKSLRFVRSLNLEHLVYSKLNPLSACTSSIVDNFAAITRHYQLLYCYAVIEKNKRNPLTFAGTVIMGTSISGTVLDMAFPFDPYMLKSSSVYITPHFQEFEGLPDDINTEMADSTSNSPKNASDKLSETGEEEDDFLEHSGTSQPSFLDMNFSPDSCSTLMRPKLMRPK